MKRARVSAIVVILTACPTCGEACISKDTGAQTITDEDKVVLCESRGVEYLVPQRVFTLIGNKKEATK